MFKTRIMSPILFMLVALVPALAWSQTPTATVAYSLSAAVPVIGSGLLLLLGAMLAAVGVFWLSRRPHAGRALSLSFALIGATLVVASSGWLVSNARAAAEVVTFLLSENASPVEVDTFPAELTNDLAVTAEVRSIDISGCPTQSQLSGSCVPGKTLAAGGGSCSIDAICANEPISGEVCFSSNQFASEDPWVICDIDANEAWISADNGGTYNATAICQALGFDAVGQQGGTCGNVCGYCEGATSCSSPGTRNFDGGGGDPATLNTTVQWTCINND